MKYIMVINAMIIITKKEEVEVEVTKKTNKGLRD
jgi:hypothetical protein